MKGSLSPWNRAESWSFRDTRHAGGMWVIANADDVTGWWVMDGAGTSIGASGPETGAAGMAAADRAAMGLGWALEGGAVVEKQHMLSEWFSDGGMWVRTRSSASGTGIATSVVYEGKGWMVDKRATLGSVTGPEDGRAGMAAADRAAVELGWTLEGGPVDMPAEPARRWGMTDAEQLARIEEAITGIGDPASSPAERVTEIVATLGRLGAERQRSTSARVADLERAIVALAVRLRER